MAVSTPIAPSRSISSEARKLLIGGEWLPAAAGQTFETHDPGTGELAHTPQPTWSDLPSLVDQARDAGLHVVLTDRLPRDAPVPDVVGRTLYRIVQEGITNAGKHAPGAVVRIEVTGSPEEGVDLVRRRDGQQFVLHGWIPWAA